MEESEPDNDESSPVRPPRRKRRQVRTPSETPHREARSRSTSTTNRTPSRSRSPSPARRGGRVLRPQAKKLERYRSQSRTPRRASQYRREEETKHTGHGRRGRSRSPDYRKAHKESRRRKDDDRELTPVEEFSDQDESRSGIILPDQAKRIMRQGFKSYIPLSCLTVKSCKEQRHKASQPETLQVLKGEIISSKAKGYSSENEKSLLPQEWHQATTTLIQLIQTYYEPWSEDPDEADQPDRLAKKYTKIFHTIATRSSFVTDFDIFLEYACDVMRWDVDRRNRHKKSQIHEFDKEHFQNLQFQAVRKATSSYSHAPNGSKDSKSSYGRLRSEFRGDKKIWVRFCGVCAGSHGWKEHRAKNGKFLSKQNGKWKDAGGNEYCFDFNHPSGCKRENCGEHFKHWCSMCGSKDGHSAPHCPTLPASSSSTTSASSSFSATSTN